MLRAMLAPGYAVRPAEAASSPRVLNIQLALMMLVLLPGSLWLLQHDPRLLNGVSIWVKPIKFELSLALHFATLAVLVDLVAPAARGRPLLCNAFLVSALAGLFEMGYIALQAARGRASHFNDGTLLETVLYQVMGVGAVLLVVVAFYLGTRILTSPRAGTGSGLRLGAGLGLTVGAIATLVTAGILGSGQIPLAMGLPPGHLIGGDLTDATGLPFVGWSTTGGDLRVPHFFATHLMQTLPVLGWLADRFVPAPWIRRTVWTGAALQLGLIGATLAQAVLGQPFIRF